MPIKRLGYDGTTLDNVSANISWWAPAGVYPTLYPSDSAWEPAMKSFIAYAGPQLKAQGLYVRASAGKRGPNDGSATKAWWTTLAPYVSGLLVEYFEQASDKVPVLQRPEQLARLLGELARSRRRRPKRRRRLLRRDEGHPPPTPAR